MIASIVLVLLGLCVVGQELPRTQTIRGTVTDAVTGYLLPGAHIRLLDIDQFMATSTDENGRFVLSGIPVGRQHVQVSFVGYNSRVYHNLLFTTGREVYLDVLLEEVSMSLGGVTVVSDIRKEGSLNEMAFVSARTFSVEETERYAGSLGDPARMVANFAGVMTQNNSRNDIIIRGNSPAGVLWRIEGIEVPNPNHFGAQGTTGGPVSMVNNNLLANSDFLTGAFPAEFGNATAGVFDLNLRSGNPGKTEFTGQIGFNGFEVGLEGPAFAMKNGQKASYLANFRYSTLEVMDRLGFDVGAGAAVPQYKDLTFMIDMPSSRVGRFKMFGLWGNSLIRMGRDLADTVETQYNLRGTATDFGSDLAVAGTSHTWFFNENTRVRSTLSWQQFDSMAVLDSLQDQSFMPFYRGNQTEQKLSFTTQLRRKVSADANYVIGLLVDRYNINFIDSVQSNKHNRFITLTDTEGSLMLYRAYGQYRRRLGRMLTAHAGLHLVFSGLNDEFITEPRIGLNWQIAEKSSLSTGFGMHSQLQPKEVYFFQTYIPETGGYLLTNETTGMTRSNHYVVGYQYLISSSFRIKTETYYQQLYRIPVRKSSPEFSMVNAGDFFSAPKIDSLVNLGKGRNLGIELTVERFLDKGWYFLFTASLFDSKYTGYDGVWRNTAFNGNYVFNLLGGYEIRVGKNSTLTMDMKTVWAGGKRFVPVNMAESLEKGQEVRDWSRSFEQRYNDYYRTDFRLGVRVNHRGFSQEWAVDLQNITGFRSLFMESFDARKNEVYQIYQQGFLPMFLYRIQF